MPHRGAGEVVERDADGDAARGGPTLPRHWRHADRPATCGDPLRLASGSVGSSSLVFVGIIGLWAAYLVPQWTRRRGQLAASRQADRFSAAARVLARRTTSGPAGAEPSAGRPGGPAAAAPGRSVSRSTAPVHRSGGPVHRGAGAGQRATATRPAGAGRARPSAGRPSRTSSGPGTAAPPPAPQHARAQARRAAPPSRRRSGAARRRALVLLALLALTAAGWASVVSPVVPWPVAVPGTLLLVLDVAALRRAARPRRLAEPARPAAARRDPRRRVATGGPSAPPAGAATGPLASAVASPPAGAGAGAGAAAAGSGDLVIDLREEVVDVRDTGACFAAGAGAVDADGRWSPVPVPPPTYTLKARAPYVPVLAPASLAAGEAGAPATAGGAGTTAPSAAAGACVPGVDDDARRVAPTREREADPAGRAAPVREQRARAVNE